MTTGNLSRSFAEVAAANSAAPGALARTFAEITATNTLPPLASSRAFLEATAANVAAPLGISRIFLEVIASTTPIPVVPPVYPTQVSGAPPTISGPLPGARPGQRRLIDEFSLDSPVYGGAIISVWVADPLTGTVSTTLAPLYSDLWSVTQVGNPQRLTARGRWQQPVYVEGTYALVASPATHEAGAGVLQSITPNAPSLAT